VSIAKTHREPVMTLAAAFLGAAFLGGLAARALRLPPLLGFLAAGFALAAAGYETVPEVETLADLGVTLLLFAVGLKLDVRSLVRREVWLTTVLHTGAMVAIGMGLLLALGLTGVSLLAGLDLQALALLAFAISFSSTVFVVKVIERRNDARSRYGQVALGILVIQDLLAVAFLAASHGKAPSIWALALPLLVLLRRPLFALWERLGSGELLVLFAVFLAMIPGYLLFEAVGLKGDLGAVAIGLLLAPHPKAGELARSIFSLKELLLVAFFLSIGLHGLPTPSQLVLGLGLLVLLPVQSLGYLVLLSWLGLRRRTATLAALALANNSEFGLIVAATAISSGLLAPGWLTTISVAVASGFVLAALVNERASVLADRIEARWPDRDAERLLPDERPIPLHAIDVLVLGMGRIGQTAYAEFDRHGLQVMGVEHDAERAAKLQQRGLDVVHGDATDSELWRRLVAVRTLRKVVLTLPLHEANVEALRVVRSRHFTGRVAAIAVRNEEFEALERNGADVVVHLYDGVGTTIAETLLPPHDEEPPQPTATA
jgi:glutathione-regulated potassium-efflux system ancillary protein KefC